MSKKANYRQIGIFVVGATVLLITAIGVFGSGKLFKDEVPAVFYFKESVKGLVIGAPVSYRGVTIGQVKRIGLTYESGTDKLFIPVHAELFPQRAHRIGRDDQQPPNRQDLLDFFNRMIKNGLRGQLAVDSLVTGQLYISLEFVPDSPMTLVGLDHDELEIPTAPSGLEQLLGSIKAMPLDRMAGRVDSILAKLDTALDSPARDQILTNMNALLQDSRVSIMSASEKLSRVLDRAEARLDDPELVKAFKNLNVLLENGRVDLAALSTKLLSSLELAEKALFSVNGLVSPGSPTQQQLSATLQEIAASARALRLFADYVERHPEAFLAGKAKL